MAKKFYKVQYSGLQPKDQILTAVIPVTNNTQLTGQKINLTHRLPTVIETGTSVVVERGFKLCFALVPELANRGVIATNAPGHFTEGKVWVNILNCGREIIEIKEGDPLITVWLEPIVEWEWEQT
jgi:hypothetical protein